MKKQPLLKLTQEQLSQSIVLYQKGFSLQKIADLWGVSRQSMWDLLRRRIVLRNQLRYNKENHFYRGGRLAEDKCHNLFEEAVERGIIKRKNKCDNCGKKMVFKNGRSGIEAHHCDYNKPLEVIWFCKKCHFEWHKNNKAKKYDRTNND